MAFDCEQYIDKLDTLSLATGLGACLMKADGSIAYITGHADFCGVMLSNPECAARCRMYHADAARESYDIGEAYVARCPFCAIAITAPIAVEGNLEGAVCLMPARMWDWDDTAKEEMRASLMGIDVDVEPILDAGSRLSDVTPARCGALMSLILKTVPTSGEDMDMRRMLSYQQRRINEMIGEIKSGGSATGYPMHIEREMLSRVRLGDKNGARALLNELLGHIFFRAPGNMRLMKARVLELVVVISRAAVESGAEMESLLGVNYDFISELSGVEDFEALCGWVVRMLDTFIDTVSNAQDSSASSQLNDALSYIRANLSHNLSLDEVAEAAHVSPYYLSHLFREKLGVSFIEFTTSSRIEMSKNYLLHTRLPVSAISEKLGYDDAGYFGKVFKKRVGMTPKTYREKGG